jgi:predicted anti-sigma-YlaC factor YlaD
MHDVIRDGLEGYLSQDLRPESLAAFRAHLAECAACRQAVSGFEQHSALLRSLRVSEEREVAPAAGFYARVMDRIDAQRPMSLWSVFLQPLFARRVMYASLALFLFLGSSILWTGEDHDVLANDTNMVGVLAGFGPQTESTASATMDPESAKDVVMNAVLSDGPVHLVSVSE